MVSKFRRKLAPEEEKLTPDDTVGAPVNTESLRRLAEWFDESPIVTTKQLAETLELTDRRVLQLVEEGFLFKKERNTFNLYECLHNFIKYKKWMIIKEQLDL